MKSIDLGVLDLTVNSISTIPNNETKGKLFHFLLPQFPHPKNGENDQLL